MIAPLWRFRLSSAAFVRSQPRNFKFMLVRRALHGVVLNLSAQYKLLAWATGPTRLFLAGFCFGFNSIAIAPSAAMASEIVPEDHLGRWTGLSRGLISFPLPLFEGQIWKRLGLQVCVQPAIMSLLQDMQPAWVWDPASPKV